jgi:hypothetical protein
MATSSADKLIDEIAQRIAARRNVYDSAMQADLALLCRTHGHGLVVEALQRLKEPRPAAGWDQAAHAREVGRAIGALLRRRAESPDEFIDNLKI